MSKIYFKPKCINAGGLAMELTLTNVSNYLELSIKKQIKINLMGLIMKSQPVRKTHMNASSLYINLILPNPSTWPSHSSQILETTSSYPAKIMSLTPIPMV